MIESLEFEKIRSECKIMIENLEYWIRNVIDNEMTKKYGSQFWDYENESGVRVISNKIMKDAKERYEGNKARYPRFVDSLLLDDIIRIICKLDLYQSIFRSYLINAFPNGNDEARAFLNRLVPIRNKLYHSNPISNHEALQALCYSNDIISSIKEHYKAINMEKEYNAPTIIKLSDSFGNQFAATSIRRNSTGRGLCDTRKEDFKVSVGDKIIIEIEVDPSYSPESYSLDWNFYNKDKSEFNQTNNRLELNVENKHVRTDFHVFAIVKSTKEWHRCGDVDDSVGVIYEIIPNE